VKSPCLITAISQPLPGFFAGKHLTELKAPPPAAASNGQAFRQISLDTTWSCAVYNHAASLPESWNLAAPQDNIFLSKTYLHALECYAPAGMDFAYILFYHHGKAAGVAYAQLLTFNAAKHIQSLSQPNPGIAQWIKQRVAASLNMPLLVCGNMLLTGAHAFHFDAAYAHEANGARLVEAATELISKGEAIPSLGAKAILAKDFEAGHAPFTQTLQAKGFHEIHFQPNMRMKLRPEWATFDDYLNAMSSKYRIRARRAFKKSECIERREMSLETAQKLDAEMHRLYRSVANHASFNMVQLHSQYFSGMKAALGDCFKIWGYYHNEQLVGFNTAIYNGKELEAHFLGFEDAQNYDFQVYLNMLYDIVREAFKAKISHIVFSRTATEIKSSIGAEACQTFCYLRHRNPIMNRIAQSLVAYLSPQEDWEPRHPFREEEVVGVELA